jgi:hypothetical protein
LGYCDDFENEALVSLSNGKIENITVNGPNGFASGYESEEPHKLALVALEDGRFGLVANIDTIYLFQSFNAPPEVVPIACHDKIILPKGVLRLQGKRTVGEQNRWLMIFADPIASQEPRYFVELVFDAVQNSWKWNEVAHLNYQDFSFDRFGMDDLPELNWEPPILGSVMIHGGSVFVFVEGSSAPALKYGMDYYSLAGLNAEKVVSCRIHEKTGLKRLPGKHGIYGSFSSSKQYAILTPVFKSSEWKGFQKIFDMNTRTLIDPEMPKGMKNFKIIDHYNGTFYLTDFVNEIAVCAMAE